MATKTKTAKPRLQEIAVCDGKFETATWERHVPTHLMIDKNNQLYLRSSRVKKSTTPVSIKQALNWLENVYCLADDTSNDLKRLFKLAACALPGEAGAFRIAKLPKLTEWEERWCKKDGIDPVEYLKRSRENPAWTIMDAAIDAGVL